MRIIFDDGRRDSDPRPVGLDEATSVEMVSGGCFLKFGGATEGVEWNAFFTKADVAKIIEESNGFGFVSGVSLVQALCRSQAIETEGQFVDSLLADLAARLIDKIDVAGTVNGLASEDEAKRESESRFVDGVAAFAGFYTASVVEARRTLNVHTCDPTLFERVAAAGRSWDELSGLIGKMLKAEREGLLYLFCKEQLPELGEAVTRHAVAIDRLLEREDSREIGGGDE